ncbi:hypothetical protein AMATHDRAFT_44104 [Amanita thiersii Skay4041]|uniref:Uncharacterized protein n=1 Tax=Amanita thiersii Skay4041 TaxID=703135 RepID=A0A2A9NCG9_9AGAR|nr:hypothetical protein AMATHDRAFT_44104 [Amanita thiersii Skay4041]
MAPAFSKSFRNFFHSSRPSMDSSHYETVKHLLKDKKLEASSWAAVVSNKTYEVGQDLLKSLREWRVCKWHYYKEPSSTQHEYIVILLKNGAKLFALRIERTIGSRLKKQLLSRSQSAPPSPHPPAASSISLGSLSRPSSPVHPVPQSSDSTALPVTQSSSFSSGSSTKSFDSNVSSSRSSASSKSRISDYCKCFISSIPTGSFWAEDKITEVTNKYDSNGKLDGRAPVKTFEYTQPELLGPSLWDLTYIVQVVNSEGEQYKLFDAQCYWFADSITGILESWVDPQYLITTTHAQQRIRMSFRLRRTSSSLSERIGYCKLVPVYTRDEGRLAGMFARSKECIEAADDRARKYFEPQQYYEEKMGKQQAVADANQNALLAKLMELTNNHEELKTNYAAVMTENKEMVTRIEGMEKQVGQLTTYLEKVDLPKLLEQQGDAAKSCQAPSPWKRVACPLSS